MYQGETNEMAPLTLSDAISICKHYQYLVDGYYDLANPGLGKIHALFIHSFGAQEEVIREFREKKIANAKVFRSMRHQKEEYDVMLVARLKHPQLKSQVEIFKDIRTYIIEQSIDFPFDMSK